MSAGMSILAILSPVGLALAVLFAPEPFLFLVSLRLRVVSDPIRAVVIAHPSGRDWFICKLPSKDSE